MGQKSSTVIDTQKRYILPSPGVMGAGNRVYGLITIYTPSEIHQLQVTPSLSVKSAKLYIDPKNKNDIKLYIGDRELTNETKLIEIDSNAMIKAVY